MVEPRIRGAGWLACGASASLGMSQSTRARVRVDSRLGHLYRSARAPDSGFKWRESALAQVHARNVAAAVAAVEAPIGQHGRRPAFAPEHLGARGGFESVRSRGRDYQLAGPAHRDEFSIGHDDRAGAEARLRPLLVAGCKIEALE